MAQYSEEELAKIEKQLIQFSYEDLLVLRWKIEWKKKARQKQLPPIEFTSGKKPYWGIRSGRGFGKSLTGSNWVGLEAASRPKILAAVVAPTYNDTRYTCFYGVTGLLSVIPQKLIVDQNKALPSITLWNGSMFMGFSADTPNRLRGPQHHIALSDEISSWKYPKEAWSNLEFGLRLGIMPQMMWTSTPKPTPFMRERNNDPRAIVIAGSSHENRENLSDVFFENIGKYEGTAIGRQEIYGELIDPEEAGFVKRSQWQLWPAKRPLPKFKLIIFSLDTAFTEKTFDRKEQKADPTAASVWGVFEWQGNEHVLLLDCWEDHLGFPQLITRVKKEREMTYGDSDEPLIQPHIRGPARPNHQGRKPDLILIEDKGSGISLRQSLAAENILTESYNPGQLDKLSRLHIVSPMFAHKRVWAVESAKTLGQFRTWADPMITQVCTYVGEGSLEHDDLLDSGTQALRLIMDKFRMVFTVKVDKEDLKRKIAMETLKRRREVNPYAT